MFPGIDHRRGGFRALSGHRAAALLYGLLLLARHPAAAADPPLMTAADAVALPRPAADHRLNYGPYPLQFGELRLPTGPGPHPVAVVVHGGCWLAAYDLDYMSALAAALAEVGVATWSVEYRRIGEPGGGWPGTFRDLAAAADHLSRLAPEYELDLERVVAIGHSAGGHLALWLAGRHRLAIGDELRGQEPLPMAGVVALAGIPDLEDYAAPEGCGAAVAGLLGGPPDELPDRVRRVSPIEQLPLGVPQILVIGDRDTVVPARQARRYVRAARRAGDRIELRRVAEAGHFELVVAGGTAWPTVRSAVLELLGLSPP